MSSRLLAFATRVLPALAYVGLIFVLGSINGPPGPVRLNDKVMHALAFGPVPILHYRALTFFLPELAPGLALAVSAAIGSAVGGLLELYQARLPHRSAEWLDWAADTAAVVAVAFCSWLWLRWRRRSSDDRCPHSKPIRSEPNESC